MCRVLRDDPRLGDAWMLAITVAAKGRMADSVLNAGAADDYLHRPFTRAELIARTLGRAARFPRALPTTACCGALMENVPGAIYRLRVARRPPARDDHRREIERISSATRRRTSSSSTKRTILTLISNT